MKFTILLLCVLDILLSISISSLDLYLHSLPPIGTELNYSATPPPSLAAGGVGWKHQRWGLPGRTAAHLLMPAAKLPLPGTCSEKARQPGHCSLVLGQAACTCIKKAKNRFEIAVKITNFTSVSTQLQIFL